MSEKGFRSILTGSFSTPCADNPTVLMMEAGYHHAGLDARYLNCDVKASNLADAVKGAKAMEWVGFNCSLPHKVAVLDYLDDVAESAKLIGAVNCVAIRDGKLIGHNTDGKGFLTSLKTVTSPTGKKVVILGAGGASRAIAVELALAGAAHITIVNRDVSKAKAIASLIRDHTDATGNAQVWSGKFSIPAETDILINATSIGLGDPKTVPPVDMSSLTKDTVVADVIPNPPQTRFLKEAKAIGCTTLDGLGMLVNQGVIGVEIWLGRTLDSAVMAETLETIFGTENK